MRSHDIVSDCAVFVAVGIETETGRRMVLGVSAALSEASEHWATFNQSLLMKDLSISGTAGLNIPVETYVYRSGKLGEY